MKVQVYSLRDNVAEAFFTPVYQPNDNAAKRQFVATVKAEHEGRSSEVGKNPGDFTLFHVGTWDDSLGVMESCGEPRRIMTGLEAELEYKKTIQE